MNKEEMLKALLEAPAVRRAFMTLSMYGNLSEEALPEAISDYYMAASVITRQLFKMNVHKFSPMENPDNANVPYLILGQMGSVQGAGHDMVMYLCLEAAKTEDNVEAYIKEQVEAGNNGKPNLIHGIITMDSVGNYMTALRDNLMLSFVMHAIDDMGEEDILQPVPHMFSKELH